jgi:hypothetical protein
MAGENEVHLGQGPNLPSILISPHRIFTTHSGPRPSAPKSSISNQVIPFRPHFSHKSTQTSTREQFTRKTWVFPFKLNQGKSSQIQVSRVIPIPIIMRWISTRISIGQSHPACRAVARSAKAGRVIF